MNVQDMYNMSYGLSSNNSSEGRRSVRKQLTKMSDPSIGGSPRIEEPDIIIWTAVDRIHHPNKLDDEGTDEFQQRMAASHRHRDTSISRKESPDKGGVIPISILNVIQGVTNVYEKHKDDMR